MPRLQLHAIQMDDVDSHEMFHSWSRPARRETSTRTERREARAWSHDEERHSQRRELKLKSSHHGRR